MTGLTKVLLPTLLALSMSGSALAGRTSCDPSVPRWVNESEAFTSCPSRDEAMRRDEGKADGAAADARGRVDSNAQAFTRSFPGGPFRDDTAA